MSSLFADTRPEAEEVHIKLLHQAPSWRKLEMVEQLNQTVCTLALSGLRQRYPQATPRELRSRLADRLGLVYLRRWAASLGVAGLIERALAGTGRRATMTTGQSKTTRLSVESAPRYPAEHPHRP